jgi:2-keto-4-pentenoate hydratase/2-oxohepta-3-ene-1,7-dioic acid hydratase in catechol pathway
MCLLDLYILGVGNGLKPPKFIRPGTQMNISVSQIGTLKNGVDFA